MVALSSHIDRSPICHRRAGAHQRAAHHPRDGLGLPYKRDFALAHAALTNAAARWRTRQSHQSYSTPPIATALLCPPGRAAIANLLSEQCQRAATAMAAQIL